MGMTVTQKILAAHAGLESVTAGQLIEAKLDVVMGNDITIALAVPEFRKAGADKVFDKDKVVVVLDHFAPNKDIKAAMQCKVCREFARENELTHFFDVGRMGIEHALLPEQGIVAPGEVIIGGDSHTCTYGALGAFSTGVGSTDLAMGMATGENWFKVPAAIRFKPYGQARQVGLRQGRHAARHRPHRRGRRALPLHGIFRQRAWPTSPWTTASP